MKNKKDYVLLPFVCENRLKKKKENKKKEGENIALFLKVSRHSLEDDKGKPRRRP